MYRDKLWVILHQFSLSNKTIINNYYDICVDIQKDTPLKHSYFQNQIKPMNNQFLWIFSCKFQKILKQQLLFNL